MSYDANDRDDEPVKRERCHCGDMPGRCPGVRNCPLEAKDEEEKAENVHLRISWLEIKNKRLIDIVAQLTARLRQVEDEAQFALRRLNHEADQKKQFQQVLLQIGDLAHDKSTGPAVPDTLWEIRDLAYGPFKEIPEATHTSLYWGSCNK